MNSFSIGIILHLIDQISKPINQIQKSVENLSKESQNVSKLTKSFEVLTKTVERTKKPFKDLQEQAEKIKNVSNSMMLRGTANVLIGISPSISAIEFEKALAEVATLTDLSLQEFKEKYTKSILELSREIGESPELVVKGMYQAISAGIEPDKVIEFIRQAGKTAIAGVSDIFTAVDLATSIKNAFNVPMERMQMVYDIIFKSVQKGKTTFKEIAHSFQQVGASAASAGISFEHVQAAVAQMTLSGVSTERAYTSLKYAIDALVAPSEQAKKAFARLGLEIDAEKVREKDLLGVLAELKASLEGLSEKERAEIISDIFGSQEALMFIKDYMSNTEKYNEMLKEIMNSAGATEAVYQKMASTTAKEWNKLKQTLEALKITLGSSILPALNILMSAFVKLLTPITEFLDKHKTLTRSLLGGFLVVSAGMVALGAIGFFVGMLINAYTNLRIATALSISGIKALMLALKSLSVAMLTTPIGWLALTLAGAALLIIKFWKPISAFFKGLWQGLKEGLKELEPAWNVFKSFSVILYPFLAPLKLIYNAIKSLLKPINDTGKATEQLGYRVGKAIAGILSFILTLPVKMFEAGMKLINSLWQGIKSVANKPVEEMQRIAQRIRNLLPFSPAKEGPLRDIHRIKIIETIAQAVKPEPLLVAMKYALEPVKALAQPLIQPVKQVLEPVKAFTQPLVQPVKQVLEPAKAIAQPSTVRPAISITFGTINVYTHTATEAPQALAKEIEKTVVETLRKLARDEARRKY